MGGVDAHLRVMAICVVRLQDRFTPHQELTMNPPPVVPVFSSAMRHLPMRLLIEPMQVDAALARLMPPVAPVATACSSPDREADADWMWTESGADAVEVTEHLLPDGIDFLQFHALLSAAH
jgi:hypothetical protein